MQFETALVALCDAEVEFVVIGGVSAALLGSAYVTYDLDICYARNRPNLQKLAKALAPFHPRPRGLSENLPFVWDEATLGNGSMFTLSTDAGAIDLWAEVAGLGTYAEIRDQSFLVEAYGRRLRILSLKNLIESKRAAGRPKDLMLIPELESLLEAGEP